MPGGVVDGVGRGGEGGWGLGGCEKGNRGEEKGEGSGVYRGQGITCR